MIHQNLKRLRSIHKFTQEDVAHEIGVSRQAIAKWESGETTPDIHHCKALAAMYEVTLDDLVHHEEEALGIGIGPKGKHMFGMVKVGEKGEIILPAAARELFGIVPGDYWLLLGDEESGLALVRREQYVEFAKGVLQADAQRED
ncbi:helix-turn-helix transcriptional regulator [Paenibacillus sp. SYP-B4298]|uniref:helix-turn-helix transcriptional regulator n=1 Tax=Paenibacillus sp. SYP-B4298 TaxID=2996034 RepID=UPI0022DD936C|nr:helix-turn-helix transcriptional regulator [Paenibacillus sp. SYP-B4298]